MPSLRPVERVLLETLADVETSSMVTERAYVNTGKMFHLYSQMRTSRHMRRVAEMVGLVVVLGAVTGFLLAGGENPALSPEFSTRIWGGLVILLLVNWFILHKVLDLSEGLNELLQSLHDQNQGPLGRLFPKQLLTEQHDKHHLQRTHHE